MSTYVIGDVQGCLPDLRQLLIKIKFRPDCDKIWFAGDLVNRGPDSVGVLRFVKSMADNAVCVLGNHDLHMLAIASGIEKPRPSDTVNDIIDAKDKIQLLEWVAHLPLMHTNNDQKQILVHAGIYPLWQIPQAQKLANEVEKVLRSDQLQEFFKNMYGNQPALWSEDLTGWQRIRFITNAFTRMRYCKSDISLELKCSVAPGQQPPDLKPWYEYRNQSLQNIDIFFGHWSTLGKLNSPGLYSMDTGCLWGGQLTAINLETYHYTSLQCNAFRKPG